MKRSLFVVALLVLLCSVGGCGTERKAEQTAFKAAFSLRSIIEANQQLLLPGTRVSSGSESGPSAPFTQKNEVMTVQVDSPNGFAFMEAIQSGIQKSLVSSGAELLGGGGAASGDPSGELSDPVHFSFNYREGSIAGLINIWGVPGEGSSLVLIVTIVEG